MTEGLVGSGELPAIDVVIPVYNKIRFLEASLESIFRAAELYGPARVFVVDNGSTDGSLELGRRACRGRAKHVVQPGVSIGELRNLGASLSSGAILCFIDCDCIVSPTHLQSVSRVLTRPGIDATGCRVDYPTDGPWVEAVWHRLHRNNLPDGIRKYINAGNFSIRRSAFENAGGFDTSLITGEDAELGQRLNDLGFCIWEDRGLAVVHLDNPRTLIAFFKKEVWHALGMFGTVRLWPVDRPMAMTLVHLLALTCASALLCFSTFPPVTRLVVALSLVSLVPAIAVCYRAWARSEAMPWVRGVILYQVYFLARITALARLLTRSLPRK